MIASDSRQLPPTRDPKIATTRALQALLPRERWTPPEWAENCRILSDEESSEPGPYTFDRTPYWRFVLELAADPVVEEIDCLKGAQVGWSETCRNICGYWIDLDPGPVMVLMPDQKAAEDFKVERIDPLIKHTPAVQRHLTNRAWDDTKHRVRFDTMTIFFVWAGSKTGTKSRPIRRLICEEPDEYPPFSSTGGDPLSKAEKRLTTYRDKSRAKILLGGTPTTRAGNISKRWEMCAVRYHYWVPCPHCGEYQLLQWKQVKWPQAEPGEDRAKHAERLKCVGLAYYECEHCKKRIDDHHKPRMLQRGVWANEDQIVKNDGSKVGPERVAKRVGVKVGGLYSPWVLFGQLASEWMEAQDDVELLSDFINQRLAEPFEQQIDAPKEDEFIAKRDRAKHMNIKAGVVPDWARAIFMTVDVQQTGMWCLIRAWGYRYRSRLIWYGYVRGFDDVYDLAVNRLWDIDGGSQCRVQMCLLDSGGGTAQDSRESRTQEVYRFCERAPGFFIPIKGESSDQNRTVRASANARDAGGKPVPLYTIHTQRLKGELMRLVKIESGKEGEWELHEEVESDFLKQMTSEHLIRQPDGTLFWKRRGSSDNHLWDCEVYQVAAADPDLGGVGRIPSAEEEAAMNQQQPATRGKLPAWVGGNR